MAGTLRQFLKRFPRLVALVRRGRRTRAGLALALAKLKVRQSDGYLLSAYGVWLRDRWEDKTYRYCIQGAYGFFYSGWLQQQTDCIFLDIGANVGLYSLVACRNPGIRAVYAFEPVPQTYEYLVDNLARSHARQCRPFPVGISSGPRALSIPTKRDHSGVSTLRETALSDIGYDSQTTIRVVGPEFLDDVVDRGGASRIAVKVDVEGHEQVVMDTLRRSRIWPQVWNIYYEVNERYLDHLAVLALLEQEGFEVIHKEGKGGEYNIMVQRRRTPA